jgi:hypothetical protein
MEEARALQAVPHDPVDDWIENHPKYMPVAEAPPGPLYEILEPTPPAPPPQDVVIDGTEVAVDNPPDSEVLPHYIVEADTEVQAQNPPNSNMLPFYATTAIAPAERAPVSDYQEPEAITLSTLGKVKPDPNTITDVNGVINGDDFEVGLGTGVYKTGAPKR